MFGEELKQLYTTNTVVSEVRQVISFFWILTKFAFKNKIKVAYRYTGHCWQVAGSCFVLFFNKEVVLVWCTDLLVYSQLLIQAFQAALEAFPILVSK